MKRSLFLCLVLSVLALTGTDVQPLLLPHDELLRRLDPKVEWALIPWEEWQTLRGSALPTETLTRRAQVERARVQVVPDGDDRAQCRVQLECVVTGPGPQACLVFPERPGHMGAFLDATGRPLLGLVKKPAKSEAPEEWVILPGPGRHTVECRYGLSAEKREKIRSTFLLPLPRASALSVHLAALDGRVWEGPGVLAADAIGRQILVPQQNQAVTISLVGGTAGARPIATGVWQHLVIHESQQGDLSFTLTCHNQSIGEPRPLLVTLPKGLVATTMSGEGLEALADGSWRLAAGQKSCVFSGAVVNPQAIDLAQVKDALWLGGEVQCDLPAWYRFTIPESWWVRSAKTFLVRTPGTPMAMTRQSVDLPPLVQGDHVLSLDLSGRKLLSRIQITAQEGAKPLSTRLSIPTGWELQRLRLRSGEKSMDISLGSLDNAQAQFLTIPLVFPNLPVGPLTLESLWSPDAAHAQGPLTDFLPPQVEPATAGMQRVELRLDPSLRLNLQAPQWSLVADLGSTVLVTGATPEKMAIDASPAVASRTIDAVVYLAPTLGGSGVQTRLDARIDLRLQVMGGRLSQLTIPDIFETLPRLESVQGRLEKIQKNLVIHFEVPFSGERTLRLEGMLSGAQAPFNLSPLVNMLEGLRPGRSHLTLQVHEDLTTALTSSHTTILHLAQRDDLPLWSRPIPGIPLSGVWRLGTIPPQAATLATLNLERPFLMRLPAGCIDDARILALVGTSDVHVQFKAILALTGMQRLPFSLPSNATLHHVLLGGIPARIQKDGDRYQVELAGQVHERLELHWTLPRENSLALSPPVFEGIPVILTRYRAAVPLHILATNDTHSSAAVPLSPVNGVCAKRLWSCIWSAGFSQGQPTLLPVPVCVSTTQVTDQRQLGQTDPQIAPSNQEIETQAPGLILEGQGHGSPPVRLYLQSVSAVKASTRWAAVCGFLAAILGFSLLCHLHARFQWNLAWRLAINTLVIIALVLACIGLRSPSLLVLPTFLETAVTFFITFVVFAPLVRWIRPVAACLLLCLIPMLQAEDTVQILGSYRSLDAGGQAHDVRVAISVQEMQRLKNLASSKPLDDLSPTALTGPVLWRLNQEVDRFVGTLDIACLAPSKSWGHITLNQGSVQVGHSVWIPGPGSATMVPVLKVEQRKIIIELPPGTCGFMRAGVTVKRRASIEAGELGGILRITSPEGQRPTLGGRAGFKEDDGTWTLLQRPEKTESLDFGSDKGGRSVVAGEGALENLGQHVVLELLNDRLILSNTLSLRMRRAGIITLPLPEGLILAEVNGSAVETWSVENGMLSIHLRGAQETTLTLSGVFPMQKDWKPFFRLGEVGLGASRLALKHSARATLTVPDTKPLRRTDAGTGEDLAWTLQDASALETRLVAKTTETSLVLVPSAVVVDHGHQVEVCVDCAFQGSGKAVSIDLPLMAPWRLPADRLAGRSILARDGRLHIRAQDRAFAAGDHITFSLVCDDRAWEAAGRRLPPLTALDANITMQAVRWGIADGTARLFAMPQPLPTGMERVDALLLRRLFGSVNLPHPLREAWQLPPGLTTLNQPALSVVAQALRCQATSQHYITLSDGRLRHSMRLMLQPEAGSIGKVELTLPPGLRLADAQGSCLGRLSDDGAGHIILPLAAPTAQAIIITCLFERDLVQGLESIVPPTLTVDGRLDGIRHTIAFAADETEMVQVSTENCEVLTDLSLLRQSLPAGVSAEAVPYRYQSKSAWKLDLQRQTASSTIQVDGLVTLADLGAVIHTDGSLTGRLNLRLVNRSRQRLIIRPHPGQILWLARVDGRVVSLLRENGNIALPVPTLATGQASIPIEITWHERPQQPRTTLIPPTIADLSILAAIATIQAPDGTRLQYKGGSLEPAKEATLLVAKSRRVKDELSRMEKDPSKLNDAAMYRMNETLGLLQQELADYDKSLSSIVNQQPSDQISSAYQVENQGNMSVLGESQSRNVSAFGKRSAQRKNLRITDNNNEWENGAPLKALNPKNKITANANVQVLENAQNLPDGKAPETGQNRSQRILGIDLLGGRIRPDLTLTGRGNNLDVTFELTAKQTTTWPRILACLGSLLMTVFFFAVIRRYCQRRLRAQQDEKLYR